MIQMNVVNQHVFTAAAFTNLYRQVLSFLGRRLAAPTKPRSRAEEADALRDFASRQLRVDPRFAEELYAAASRHERAA